MKENNSNEKAIREIAKQFLAKHHSKLIIDEFTGGNMKRRPDLTCITDEHIIMVEIKSDKDTFERLEHQILEYKRYSNHVYVFIDICHRDKLLKFKDNNYDVCWLVDFILFDNGRLLCPYTQKDYNQINEPRYIPIGIDFINLLWAEERRRLLYGFVGYNTTFSTFQESEALFYVYTLAELIQLSFEIVKNRWKHISKQDNRWCKGYKGGNPTSQIKHREYKQILFNDYLLSIGKKIKEPKNNLFTLKENIL